MNLEKSMHKIQTATEAYKWWRDIPAPKRGELIRVFGNLLREHKQALASTVTAESKKTYTEALGEVQEAIDMCDFATGLSRQIGGLTLPSERPNHSMQERWHPLGVIGVITAFNFPVAVWAWNFCLAIICGNSVVWKPSERSEQCARDCQEIFNLACDAWDNNSEPAKQLLQIINGGSEAAIELAENPSVALVSATGSCEMGRNIYPRVAQRLGKCLLELGGNNAAIITPSADMELTVKACTFAAVGTSGQRCTTLRRAFVHSSRYDEFVTKIKSAYATIPSGDPMDPKVLMGPLISGRFVEPLIVEKTQQDDIMRTETFEPILYVMKYDTLEQAIHLQNDVPQGLSSCIFTQDIKEMEHFISAHGSDCGIANVNIGPIGAEIGGAFGGEKDTGGGRESGSDSWKSYMRRQTITINYGNDLPLAQGVKFDF
jgi:aldehyde dehydrogenase (NAD+)